MKRTLFMHDFTNVDFAWICPQRGLLGESLRISASVEGEIDELRGFIMDFGPCKKWLKKLVDDHLDHKCVIPTASKELTLISDNPASFSFNFNSAEQNFSFTGPLNTLVLIEKEELTLNDFTNYLAEIANREKPERVKSVTFQLTEEPTFETQANYRYTHGLKHHQGNCQRLLHGHRNPVEVKIDDQTSKKHESYMAEYFDRVHFVPENSLSGTIPKYELHQRDLNSNEIFHISYPAPQGNFKAQMPVKDCVVMSVEPSIESITEVTWNILRREFPELKNTSLVVSCYEGLNKGCSYGN